MDSQELRFRNKVTFIQFLLSIGIVYQHTQWNFRGNKALNEAQSFLFYLIETCVPFFFMISGYLFFRIFMMKNMKKKILSRAKTLLVPYLVWNAFYTRFMVGMMKLEFIQNTSISNRTGGIVPVNQFRI